MQSATEAAAAGPTPPTFSQVVFTDIPYSYPPATSITCAYTITAALQPNARDWVGIFKVGWSSTKDYHTFVWVEPCLDVAGQPSQTRQAVFKDYYLPKDEVEFYQFCYIDNSGQVRGASTPFCFRNPESQSMESSQEDELLVITTQEQVDQSVREKAELQRELKQLMEENEALKSALQKEQQEAVNMKAQSEEKEKEKLQLVKDLDQVKQQNESLKSAVEQQQKETDQLKEEMLVHKIKHMELEQQSAAIAVLQTMSQSCSLDTTKRQNEKYEQAVLKINQLKEVRKELQGTVDAQSGEITRLNASLREQERELFKMTDRFQLMQVDLQSSEQEKERLRAELQRLQTLADNTDDVKRENRELSRRLSEQETVQTCPDDDLRAQCQSLTAELRDAQAKLAAEKEESKNNRRQVEFLTNELTDIRTELNNVVQSYEQEQRKSSKLELQLREAHEAIAEKVSTLEGQEGVIRLMRHEKDELVRENETLSGDMEELRRVYADFHPAPHADTPQAQPDADTAASTTTKTTSQEQQEAREAESIYENIYDAIGGDAQPGEETLVCRHCQESFPLITRQELEQHEQSHRVCPFCTMICDNMEQSVFEDHVYGHEL